MRCLAVSLLAALGLAAVACGSADDGSSDGSLQIDPVNGCVSGGNCQRSDSDDAGRSSSAKDAAAPSADPTTDPTPAPTTPTATPTENTCETAVDMGEMNGEHISDNEPGTPQTITGTCSEWVMIRVKETSSLPSPLGVDAKLTSPGTQRFDLYGYVDTVTDDLSCTTPTGSATTTLSPVDEVSMTWNDSLFSDDSRTVTFEVKSHDGKCPAGESWSLVVDNFVNVEVYTPPVTPQF